VPGAPVVPEVSRETPDWLAVLADERRWTPRKPVFRTANARSATSAYVDFIGVPKKCKFC
jgi:hypothetical protein